MIVRRDECGKSINVSQEKFMNISKVSSNLYIFRASTKGFFFVNFILRYKRKPTFPTKNKIKTYNIIESVSLRN